MQLGPIYNQAIENVSSVFDAQTQQNNLTWLGNLPMSMEQPISLYREKTTIYNNEGGGTPRSTPSLCNCLTFLLSLCACYCKLLHFTAFFWLSHNLYFIVEMGEHPSHLHLTLPRYEI